MLLKADIRFKRNQYDDGFGFTCLKAAYHFGIKGRMDYSKIDGVVIKAEGESQCIREFLHWLEGNAFEINELSYSQSPLEQITFKEFDLFRHVG